MAPGDGQGDDGLTQEQRGVIGDWEGGVWWEVTEAVEGLTKYW